MPCFHPLVGYRTERGTLRVSPRRFDGEVAEIQVGCGKCLGCLARNAREKMIRIMHETQVNPPSCFVTLTYDDEHLPPGRSLDLDHLQKFLKKLRRKMGLTRYFAIGEYGPETLRPHYHLILFLQDFKFDRYFWRKSDKGYPLDRSPTLETIWTFGSSEIGQTSLGSASYVARYVQQKQIFKKDWREGEPIPEFTTMSRRPGLGRDWIQKFYSDVWPRDEVILDGKRFPPPRYYDKILEGRDPELYELIKKQREERGRSMAADNTLSRLASKEIIASQKNKQQVRKH